MANAEDKFGPIEKISETLEKQKLDPEAVEPSARATPNKEQFDALMNEQRTPTIVRSEATSHPSTFMEQIQSINSKVSAVGKANPQEIAAQAQEVIKQIETVKTQLNSPDLQLKGSVQNLLKNKLSHIDESLKVVMNRAGLEYTPHDLSTSSTSLITPIERFIGFLTHGQYQLQKLSTDVEMMHLQQKELSPASMLAIQIKVGYIQQEVEFFANMLNKALESTKTIMNVQI